MTGSKLGSRQWDLLDRICRTNGGGVSCYGEHESTYRSLERRGLIQGKSGQQYRAVHTREGLALWKATTAIADRNPSGGDVKQAPSRSDESSGAKQSPITPCNQTTP